MRSLLNSLNDARVSSAAAEVIIHAFDDILAAGVGIFQKKAVGGEDHPWCAESALQGIVLDESRLERMKLAVGCSAFDGDDLLSIDI